MNEVRKKERRAYKTEWERKRRAGLSEAEKQRKSQAVLARYHSQSPEERSHRLALERLSWAKRERKAALAKMSQEQREREVDRWAKLATEQQQAEDTLAFALHLKNTNAIDDMGTDSPDHSLSEQWSYARDKKVRGAVLRRAKGKCEFCGKPGFILPNRKRYLETHHVIYLANDGADKLTNVIAVCPNDHREAHFGKRREVIESEMILRLKAINR